MKKAFGNMFVFDADKGTGGGTAAPAADAPAPASQTESTAETPASSAPAGGQPPAADASKEKTFTQAQLDEIIRDRLAQEKRSEKARQKEADDAKVLEDLKTQKQFEALAEKHEARAKELQITLDDTNHRLEVAEAALKKYAEKDIKALPKHIAKLLDGKPTAEIIEYIAEHRETLFPASSTTPAPDKPVTTVPDQPTNAGDKNTDKEKAAFAHEVQGYFK